MSIENISLASKGGNLNSGDLAERFLARAIQISTFGREIGLNINPTSDRKLLLFRELSLKNKLKAVEKIELSCEIFSEIAQTNADLRSSFSVVWMACNRLKVRPPSDFFDKLLNDDIVQIYSQDSVHRFSNLRLFDLCSYTLEQIYTLPWNLLWSRAAADMAFLIGCVKKVTHPDQKATMMINSDSHRVYELSSPFKYELEYRLKCVAPLFDRGTGKQSGYIVCEAGKLLTKHTRLEEERLLSDFEYSLMEKKKDLGSFS